VTQNRLTSQLQLENVNYTHTESRVLLEGPFTVIRVEMHDEIFYFEIFKNFMKILKYYKTPF